MTSTAKWFTYRSINDARSIRILRVYGSCFVDSPVECGLLERSLEDQQLKYEAISYCWEGQEPTQTLLCEKQALLVTKNCELALKRFRPTANDETRLLWIDAVCIDQTATRERGHQVNLMGEIFNKADHVLAWLGNLEESNGHETFGDRDLRVRTFRWLVRLADAAVDHDIERRDDRLFKLTLEPEAIDLTELVRQVPWFKRLWVVQEIVLCKAATLVYGRFEASLDAIIKAKMILGNMERMGKASAERASQSLWNAFATHHQGSHLLGLSRSYKRLDESILCHFIAETRFSGTSDNRDKILALHSLLTAYGVPLPEPDYSKSAATIYRETTMTIMQTYRSLRILEQVDGLGPTLNMTSWVPDWASSKHSIGLEDDTCADVPYSEPFFQFRDGGQQLILKGIGVDTVTTRSSFCYMHADERLGHLKDYASWTRNPSISDLDWEKMRHANPQYTPAILRLWNIRVLQDFALVALDGSPTEASDASILALHHSLMSQVRHTVAVERQGKARAAFRTLCTAWNHPDDNEEPDRQWMLTWLDMSRTSPSDVLLNNLTETHEYRVLERISRSSYCKELLHHVGRTRYKTIFKTASGRIGIAPWSIKSGDEIMLFSGARLPLVTRRLGQRYRLIAHAHVHSIMHGEAWPQDSTALSETCLI
ncbi:HET-domain-containing protein [Viridothelium virens]|uniref:HET-domain-containing protein n=1 Tax=Viridothelium virens TaxID=1048519 RepID=A0A6A6HGE7_VIRVR|nr:HET-domain-containing protein [Viridothelium virens]